MNYNNEERRFDNHAYVWLFRREAAGDTEVSPKPRGGDQGATKGR